MDNETLIQKFLSHTLEGPEIAAFKNKMASDPEFAKSVKEQASVLLTVQAMEKADERLINKQSRRIFVRRSLAAAASILVISLVAFLFLRPSPEIRLAKQYFQPTAAKEILDTDAQLNLVRTSGQPSGEEEENFKKGLKKYQQEKYAAAILDFEEAITDSDFRNTVLLYRGNAFMELKEYNKANKDFQSIIDGSQHTETLIKATWYQALNFLYQGNKDAATQNLEALKPTDTPFAKKAQDLLLKF